jgi:uncharacterized protein DUF3501
MPHITRDSLMSLEAYARERAQFRARVIAHKKHRTLHIGPDVTLFFEDELTMRYQIQEMLRAERIFEEEGIADELSVYNPLVPDGSNWKATMMIEYPDPVLRAHKLAELVGIQERIWARVQGIDPVFAIADEDLERETGEKTSSVHFLRFELQAPMIRALKAGAALSIGIDHPKYRHESVPVPDAIRGSLVQDLA